MSANFKPKRTAAASRGFLATARLSCLYRYVMKISDRQPKISDSLKISDVSNSFGVLQHPKHPQQYAYAYNWLTLFAVLTWTVRDVQCESKKILPWDFLTFFPKRLGIFGPNFTCLLSIPIYVRLQIFIQLSATLTKLCHIKRDHHHMFKMSTIGRNAR